MAINPGAAELYRRFADTASGFAGRSSFIDIGYVTAAAENAQDDEVAGILLDPAVRNPEFPNIAAALAYARLGNRQEARRHLKPFENLSERVGLRFIGKAWEFLGEEEMRMGQADFLCKAGYHHRSGIIYAALEKQPELKREDEHLFAARRYEMIYDIYDRMGPDEARIIDLARRIRERGDELPEAIKEFENPDMPDEEADKMVGLLKLWGKCEIEPRRSVGSLMDDTGSSMDAALSYISALENQKAADIFRALGLTATQEPLIEAYRLMADICEGM